MSAVDPEREFGESVGSFEPLTTLKFILKGGRSKNDIKVLSSF